MRRIAFACVPLLAIALLTGSSLAGSEAQDDGCLVVTAGKGIVTINAKGFVFGRFDQGQVDIDDPISDDGNVRVFGEEKKRALGETKTRYIGDFVRFRAGGLFRIRTEAIGIELSLAGKGIANITSDGLVDAGEYSIDASSFCESRFQPLPDVARKLVISEQTTG